MTPALPGALAGDSPALEDLAAARARVERRLAPVARVIAVMSGKGGVGKSAVAVNLALALARRGLQIGLLDADLHGPSVAKMLGLRGQPLRLAADDALHPIAGPSGLRVQSMDFFLQGNQPLAWEGEQGEAAALRSAMEHAALADLLACTEWGSLDALVVDLAPGADRLPAFAQWLPGRVAALAVTIPSEVALLAVERSLRRAYAARVPLIGLVENFASCRVRELRRRGAALPRGPGRASRAGPGRRGGGAHPVRCEPCAGGRRGPGLLRGRRREVRGRPRARGARRKGTCLRAAGSGGRFVVKRALACLLLAFPLGLAALTGNGARALAAQGWAYDLMNELMSPYCPGRLLSDCPSPQAQTLRMWLIVQEASGRPRAEVEAEVVARYGESILGAPRAEGFGLAAYVMPAAVFVAGAALLTWFLRRQTRSAATPKPVAPSAPLDPELERLVDEKLAER